MAVQVLIPTPLQKFTNEEASVDLDASNTSTTDAEVIAALTALGYSVVEAQAALQSIPKDAPDDTGERLRLALGYFQ